MVLALLKLMGVWGLLFVWVTQSRINTANYYLATVNMQAFFLKVAGLRAPKFVWALVVGAVVYALMMADIFSRILQALAYQGSSSSHGSASRSRTSCRIATGNWSATTSNAATRMCRPSTRAG